MAHQFTHELTKIKAGQYNLTITTDCYSEIASDKVIKFTMTIKKDGNRCWRVSSIHQMSAYTLGITSTAFHYSLKEAVEFYCVLVANLINFNVAPMNNYVFAQNSGGFLTITGNIGEWSVYSSWRPNPTNPAWTATATRNGFPRCTAVNTRRMISGLLGSEIKKMESRFAHIKR